MACPFPYTYVSCPCADTPVPDPARKRRSRESPQKSTPERTNASSGQDTQEVKPPHAQDEQDEEEEEEQTFDPRSPRSNFSLYPPEQLLYCEDCHQIKCPRCITEEIVSWYCPNCLFETPSSMVRGDANRYVHVHQSLFKYHCCSPKKSQMRSELLQLSRLYSSAICQYN